MKSPVFKKYQSRFFYLRLTLIALIMSIIVVYFWEGKYNTDGHGPLTFAVIAVLCGIATWVFIVSFPSPFNPESLTDRSSMRERLLQERVKAVMLILSIASILYTLHAKNTPPFPKTGLMFVVAGLAWSNWILWPEIKRTWREDMKRRKEKKGWRIGF